jgi:tRNA pseudouridine32 synthase / 23S rRNA pseudouridine746 synthase
LGLPIIGDPLYPEIVDVAPDDFSTPLRLLAHSIEFPDPVSGCLRRIDSERTIDE